MAFIALVAMGGLAWDVSRAYSLRAELDAAVDAAALAGATQLDGNAGAIDRATAAAKGAIVTNSQRLGKLRGSLGETNVEVTDILFLSKLSPRTYTTDYASANYIQVDLAPRTVGPVTGILVRVADFSAKAHAVAGYGAAICKVPPIFVCNPAETATVHDFDPNQHIGKGITLKSEPGDTWFPGNFGYLSVTGEDGIKEAMGAATPQIQCFGRTVETQTGNITAADQYFNTRFGFYQGSANSKSNDPRYLPSQNTITGRGDACTPAAPTYTACSAPSDPASMGLPRDCCGYGGGTCSGPSTSPLGNGDWEWEVYKRVNHGTTPDPTDWSQYGGPNPTGGARSPTRYQVYQWENAKIASGNIPASMFQKELTGDSRTAACYTGSSPVTQQHPDRRTISVLVANCRGVNFHGHVTLTAIAYMDIFLTEPVDLTGPPNDQRLGMYGEIIGATTDVSAVGQETRLYSVRLYE